MIDKEIEKKANKILTKLRVKTFPVDLEAIARHYGIFITEAPNKDELSGLLLKSAGKTIIGINSTHSESRKRFTIAHELGHYFLHTSKDTFVDESRNLEIVKYRHKSFSQSKEEKEANNFAAAILMPSELIKKHFGALKEVMEVEEVTSYLSEKYEVSMEAMKYRLINLKLVLL